MPQYRVSGTRDYACSNPDGKAKPFSLVFVADDDDAAKTALSSLRGPGESWESVQLVRVVVSEEVVTVAL